MAMIEKDLRSYLQRVEQADKLLCIDKAVDPATEAPALLRQSIERGKTLMFRNIAGRPMRAVGNTLASRQWIETALGCGEQGILSWLGERSSRGVAPVCLASGPVKESAQSVVDLRQLPILTFYERDGGPYITAGVGIQKDPETGRQNAGFYSLQLKGKDRLALRMLANTHGYELFQKRLSLGMPTEMAVAIGLHPVEMLAAATHTLFDEFEVAGAMRGEAVELVKCDGIDVDVPAHAEIVLEGKILADTREPEGPIGDWLGYYPLVEQRHILKIERVTMRRDAVYQTVMSGTAEENLLLSLTRGAWVLKAAKKAVSGVKNVSLDRFLPVCVIQLQKRFEGEPMNAILAAFGEVPFIKVCIAVDEDVDIYNMNDVMWAVVTRTRLEEDVNVIGNLMGFSRDPNRHYKSKLAIDATFPLERKEHYRRARVVNQDIDLDAYLPPEQ